ncbi:hypothetical protein MY1884_008964 [Beauveria asiatica]
MDGPIRTLTTSSTFPQSLPSLVNVNGQDAYAQLQPTGNTPPLPAQLSIVHYFILFPSYSGNSLTFSSQKSAANGALCLVDAAADNPLLVSFAHLYPPTITAVLYTLAWNLGRPRREAHAAVAAAPPAGRSGRDGMRTRLIFGLSGCPSFWYRAPVLARRTVDTSYRSILSTHPNKLAMLDQSILNAGYAATWLNQALLPYTAPEYALRPLFPFSGPLMALLLLRACRRRRSMLSEDPSVDGMLPAAVGRGQWRELSRPSSSFNANLLLTNCLPDAFSTLVEPLWVLLSRFHYILWL